MANKNFSTQASRMFSFNKKGSENKDIESNTEENKTVKNEAEENQTHEEINKREKIVDNSKEDIKVEDRIEKTTKLTIEIPLSASLKINRIVDAKKLNGEKYSKQKFLTEAVLEAIEKAK
mgnify:CR=1 FL=1